MCIAILQHYGPQNSVYTCLLRPLGYVINEGSDDMVLEEDTYSGTIRFVDDNEYVILEVKNDVIANQYFCRVTNKEGFQTERAPTTYTLNPG